VAKSYELIQRAHNMEGFSALQQENLKGELVKLRVVVEELCMY
jgi:hypothetical protein